MKQGYNQISIDIKPKAKTLPQAIEDIKKEAVAWGGEITSEKTFESQGRLRQIEVRMVFKVH